jgi:hypothetical protein
MAPTHALDVPHITPTQVWARVAAEQQQQIVRLLAQLAVQRISAEAPWPTGFGNRKEASDVRSTQPIQNPPRPS